MSLQDLLLEELRDLYSAENQLVKALPKIAKAVGDPDLKDAVKNHLLQTKGQIDRLKEIFGQLGKKPSGAHCNGMEGLIKEGSEAIESDEHGSVKDVELIGASLRVEHYEVAGYTSAIAIAKALGHKEIVTTLTETLNEEKDTAKLLLDHSKPLLKSAATEDDEEEEEEEEGEPGEEDAEEGEEPEGEIGDEEEEAEEEEPVAKGAVKKRA